ncbi:SusD/RagB family nutrient-binding outer membrane lipoprotein [Hymenobacter volaticus]|uniref:SusD/RagB family nutrient-binding outer membrane lipoprotein n=1 Tax=Hymenobacter volaticus TaxID=2932254 RepID=A0ABY4G352_9BACT|nr:SusD/RagB family nutrient-binding outer membrane lipoprotein [Hymenobacter volaticus]UOQ65295.1 SusD/RagB family nutrient-binding outer membrane lipoprotein [Hymenobacter volaticus]
MKISFKILALGALVLSATGCENFIDINENPNAATAVTPDAILAQALAATAANYTGGPGVAGGQNYNSYTSFAAGYWGKSGGVSGFGEERTYNYSTSYNATLFVNTYDNLNDYQLIQQNAALYPNHAAIARIMKAYNFLLLVDEWGDIPYTQALQGATETTPAYDDDVAIYADLLVQLTGAIADINAVATDATARTVGTEDIVFNGNMTKWKQFANSLKLRILMRQSQTPNASPSVTTQLLALQTAPDGFITADVVAQPGYAQSSNQQNPFYTRYGLTAAGTAAGDRAFILPTNYIINQYKDNNDPRLTQLYGQGTKLVNDVATPGYYGTDLGEANPPAVTGNNISSRFLLNGGLLKGASAPTVLMLLSEQLFLEAEAETRGLFGGGESAAKQDYLDGIKASFMQFYRTAGTDIRPARTGDVPATATIAGAVASTPGVAQYNTYITANATNPLVNYDLAPTNGSSLRKQSVIIYQKYLAENTIASTEAWADFRRTGQPKFTVSREAATPGRLPKRLLYPLSEINTNNDNLPQGVDQYTPVFWDVVD